MSYWRNYIVEGFDERDGLDHGRWMRDTWGVVRWVQTSEPTRVVGQHMRGECVDCEQACHPRATRCASCAVRHRYADKRAS